MRETYDADGPNEEPRPLVEAGHPMLYLAGAIILRDLGEQDPNRVECDGKEMPEEKHGFGLDAEGERWSVFHRHFGMTAVYVPG
jgi:hypothetical protein